MEKNTSKDCVTTEQRTLIHGTNFDLLSLSPFYVNSFLLEGKEPIIFVIILICRFYKIRMRLFCFISQKMC